MINPLTGVPYWLLVIIAHFMGKDSWGGAEISFRQLRKEVVRAGINTQGSRAPSHFKITNGELGNVCLLLA